MGRVQIVLAVASGDFKEHEGREPENVFSADGQCKDARTLRIHDSSMQRIGGPCDHLVVAVLSGWSQNCTWTSNSIITVA